MSARKSTTSIPIVYEGNNNTPPTYEEFKIVFLEAKAKGKFKAKNLEKEANNALKEKDLEKMKKLLRKIVPKQ